ncbi:hypothetical protein KBZ10_11215 [Streptomyces sp. F63]|uniref:hypothetical protein n=1 Tax=Streptomyces sp. F63 TaxID=2824887 RepID=UPI001B3621CB|nr:hypothetical protein [Streptomyces sp. F63]MBQ0985077.1 hypothetical protein [Streptomyces sp. F63]
MAERGTNTGRDDGSGPFDEEAAWAAIVAGYGEEPEFPGDDPPAREPAPGPGALPGFPDAEKPLKPFPADSGAGPEGPDPGAAATAPGGPGPSGTGPENGTGPGSARRGPGAGGTDSPGAAGASGPADPADSSGTEATGTGGSGSTGVRGSGPADGAGRPLGSSIVFPAGMGPRDWSPREPAEHEEGSAGADEEHFVPPEPPPLPEADTPTKFAWLAVLGGPLLLIVTVLFQQPVTWWIAVLGVGGFLGGFATLVARMRDDDEEDDDPGRGAVV